MKPFLAFFIAVAFFCHSFEANGQIKLDMKKKILTIDKRDVKKETQAVQQKNENQKTQENKENKQDQKNVKTTTSANTDKQFDGEQQVALQSSSVYDFVPGEKMILYDDFSQDAVGDFPALWTANAGGEINTLNIAQGNWLNLNSTDGNYFLLKSIDFPKNFIIEFDIVPKKGAGRIAAGLVLYGEDKPKEMDNAPHPGTSGIFITMDKQRWSTMGYKSSENSTIDGSSDINPVEQEKVNHVIIWVQNRRFRIYHKQAKVLDIPTNVYDGTKFNRLCFRLSRGASCSSYISNLRITDASPDMRSKLLTDGKLVSYGIYFDVNKDIVKPESFGTLKEIAKVLAENPDVRVKIVGHTDCDGADPANMDLSKRRGASIKNSLIKEFAIDASRLESDGMGESQPVAANDTPGNKALNRRVEFIKL